MFLKVFPTCAVLKIELGSGKLKLSENGTVNLLENCPLSIFEDLKISSRSFYTYLLFEVKIVYSR